MITPPKPFAPFPLFSETSTYPLGSGGRTVVPVTVQAHSYDIHIGRGLLADLGQALKEKFPKQSKYVVITDDQVTQFALPACQSSLESAGLKVVAHVLPSGEKTKSFSKLEGVLDFLLAEKVERTDRIIALGGGVIGDLVGFAASLLRRGTGFIQIPTTLLSQVDSSVGGKTAVNSKYGKNLIGAFHQPDLVWADTGVLSTLPVREKLAGYAEVVKYGLLGDASFFEALEDKGVAFLKGDSAELETYIVAHACRMKADIVQRDEKEKAERALLNLGHTFGHALEAEMGYDGRLLHGEGISIGCVLAFDLSAELGLCSSQDAVRVRSHFQAVGLPVTLAERGIKATAEQLLEHMTQDKKVIGGKITLILASGIGQAFITQDVNAQDLLAFLKTVV